MAESFYEVLTLAVNDLAEHGYDSAERVAYWQDRIRRAAETATAPLPQMEQMLKDALAAVYDRLVEKGDVVRLHPGIPRFTLERLKPQLRAELDRRILASADLIRLNRKNSIEKTLQRFVGWSTSIPKGGSDVVDKAAEKKKIRKSLAQLPFEERRVLIDQGHKLRASISEIVAKDGNAIAGVWNSHFRERGYNYRVDHKERDGNVYMLRGNWAQERGFVKPGPAGYYDQITATGEEIYCRCWMTWIYTLRDLPSDMLTRRGAAELERVRMTA